MALKIIWSKKAEQGYARIVRYIEDKFTDKDVRKFIRETNQFFNLLQKNPYLLKPTKRLKNLYRGPMNRLTILTYHFKPRKKEIYLVNIRDARQKPLKK